MFLGVDYYPEYWDEELIDSDLEKMVEMGVTIVRIGEFSWHLMEKTEGEYDFSYFDRVVHKLKSKGIKIVFGTPTATFPAWLAKKAGDEILSVDENLQQRTYGGRRVYCFNSETYKGYCDGIVARLISHYRNEESIIAWQMDNEPGHEGSDSCYCETCKKEFRGFLKKKYISIDALNKAYGTIFWGQTYNDFDEVPLPVKTITQHNPALQLDYARFRSESLKGFIAEQASLVRRCMGSHQQLTVNLEGGFFEKWFDFEKTAVLGDFVAYDNYPVWGGLKEPLPPAEIAMGLDFIRGLSYGLNGKHKSTNEGNSKLLDPSGANAHGSFWVMEQLMGAQGHNVIGYRPRPNQAAMWSWQAMARGCSNMLYFSWRSMTRGTEQFCHGLMGHDNEPSVEAEEAKLFFDKKKELTLKDHFGQIKPEVAVLYDYDNIWSWRIQPQSGAFDFKTELMRLYTPFHDLNTWLEVIPSNREIEAFKVVVVPVMQIISKALGEKLSRFAKNGGTVVFSFRAGLRDENNNILETVLPGVVSEMCGIKINAYEALQTGQSEGVLGVGDMKGLSGRCSVWRDFIKTETAETLCTYEDSFYKNYSCITENDYGNGKVFYIGAGVDSGTMRQLVERIVGLSGIETIKAEYGLEICKRIIDGKTNLLYMNHTGESKEYEGKTIPPYGFGTI